MDSDEFNVVIRFESNDPDVLRSGHESLQDAAEILQDEGEGISVERASRSVAPGMKGPLTDLVVGAASQVIGTLIVSMLLDYVHRPARPDSITIRVDNSEQFQIQLAQIISASEAESPTLLQRIREWLQLHLSKGKVVRILLD